MSSMAARAPDATPLVEDADGVIRVGRTRVTLDVVVDAFDDGATPEQILDQYPTLGLADVYSVLAHVIRYRAEVDAYLNGRREKAAAVRAENERATDTRGLRARLLARREGA